MPDVLEAPSNPDPTANRSSGKYFALVRVIKFLLQSILLRNADDTAGVIGCRDGVVHCAPSGLGAVVRASAGESVLQE